MRNQEMTEQLAKAVRGVWMDNQPHAKDRGIAVAMLKSNLEYRERGDETMLYGMGNTTPDELAGLIAYWTSLAPHERQEEYMAVCVLVDKQQW